MGLQPATETFKFSTDPQLDAKIRDVVGFMNPRQGGGSVLMRRARSRPWTGLPILPMRPGFRSAPPTTTSATAPRRCSPRSRSPPARSAGLLPGTPTEFLTFLRQVAKAHPRRCIWDNYATHKHPP